MKKFWFILVWFLGLIRIIPLIVFISEPYYLQEIVTNTQVSQSFDTIKNEGGQKQQNFTLGNHIITEEHTSSYYEIPLNSITEVPLQLSVLTWRISYRLYTQNPSFKSIFSPRELDFIDASTGISNQSDFNCIKIANHKQNDIPNEKCKYIVVYTDKYPELRLEIYANSWSIINFK